jgi:pimeloyl-ACP methyl ester carboxylesterase
MISIVLAIFLTYPLIGISSVCPEVETATEKFIEVDLYPNLEEVGAEINNIPNLKLHREDQQIFKGKKLKIFYRLRKPFDPNKRTIMLFTGGPGQTSDFILTWYEKYGKEIENYNVVSMDHRVIGCSQKTFYDHLPATAHKMRFAAADAELIRRELLGDKPWIVEGGSYGTLLAQTYALLFPNNVSKLILLFTNYSAENSRLSRRTIRPRFNRLFPDVNQDLLQIEGQFPDLGDAFFRFSVRTMYLAHQRPEIPKMMEKVKSLLTFGMVEEARNLFPKGVYQASFMQNSIVCLETEPYPILPGEYSLYTPIESCQVFEGYYDYFDYSESLQHLKMRTLIWHGEHDPVFDSQIAFNTSALLPNNFLFVVPGGSHAVGELGDCYPKVFFAFLDEATDEELLSVTQRKNCQRFAHESFLLKR